MKNATRAATRNATRNATRLAASALALACCACTTDDAVSPPAQLAQPAATAAAGTRAAQTFAAQPAADAPSPAAQPASPSQSPAAATPPAAAAEPDAAALFDNSKVHELALTFSPADWQARQADLQVKLGKPTGGVAPGQIVPTALDPAWVPADAVLDGQLKRWIGVRYKGQATLQEPYQQGFAKLPFRIDFDHFAVEHPETKGQRCFGLQKLTFANGWNDATYLRDVLASEILRDRGVPAPRATFVRVTIDHGDGPHYAGLFTAVEDPSDRMPQEVFQAAGANVYKAAGGSADWQVFDQPSFAKQTNAKTADGSEIEAAIAALHAPRAPAEPWRKGLEATLDVQGFLRWLAVETAMWNQDIYGYHGANYYLVAVAQEGGRLHWVPWDHNEAFQMPQGDGQNRQANGGYSVGIVHHDEVSAAWPLLRWLLDDPVYRAAYDAELAKALQGAYATETFAARAKQLHALIEPHVHGPQGEKWPNTAQYADASGNVDLQPPDALIGHAQKMHALVAEAIGK